MHCYVAPVTWISFHKEATLIFPCVFLNKSIISFSFHWLQAHRASSAPLCVSYNHCLCVWLSLVWVFELILYSFASCQTSIIASSFTLYIFIILSSNISLIFVHQTPSDSPFHRSISPPQKNLIYTVCICLLNICFPHTACFLILQPAHTKRQMGVFPLGRNLNSRHV